MLYVKEMTPEQRKEIVDAASADGFRLKEDHHAYLIFEKGFRELKILSTNIHDQEMGIEIDYDLNGFLGKYYEAKPRHSISLNEAVSRHNEVQDACNAIRWTVNSVISLQNKSYNWASQVHAENIYAITIGDLPHVIVPTEDGNYNVYEGPLNAIASMGQTTVGAVLDGTHLATTLSQLNSANS